jgi:hypothetical protein
LSNQNIPMVPIVALVRSSDNPLDGPNLKNWFSHGSARTSAAPHPAGTA